MCTNLYHVILRTQKENILVSSPAPHHNQTRNSKHNQTIEHKLTKKNFNFIINGKNDCNKIPINIVYIAQIAQRQKKRRGRTKNIDNKDKKYVFAIHSIADA